MNPTSAYTLTLIIYMYMMNAIFEAYTKAHRAYMQYKDTNKTNSIEQAWLPIAYKVLQSCCDEVYTVGDSILNYIGVDFVCKKGTKDVLVDLKVYQHGTDDTVLIDVSRQKGGVTHSILDYKLTTCWLYINKTAAYLVSRSFMQKILQSNPPTFYMKRDIYKTTQKAIIQLSDYGIIGRDYVRIQYKE